MKNAPGKIYGRSARIRQMITVLTDADGHQLPDMCIDMMYSVMLTF